MRTELFAEELDARSLRGFVVTGEVRVEGDTRVVVLVLRGVARTMDVPAASFPAADCADAPAALAAKVAARVEGVPDCLWTDDCRTPVRLDAIELPVTASVGVGDGWGLRGAIGARAVWATGPVRPVVGAEGSVGGAYAVGSGSARGAEGLAVVGAAGGPKEGEGLRFEGGLLGGLGVVWGEEPLLGAVSGPVVAAWGGATLPVAGWLRVGVAARVYGVRVGVCAAWRPSTGDRCDPDDVVAEPWARVELRVVPTLRREKTAPQ